MSDEINFYMIGISGLWLITVLYVARQCQSVWYGSVGLPASFVFATTFLYSSVFLYTIPGYTHIRIDSAVYLKSHNLTVEAIEKGALQTLLGLIGFAIGTRLYMGLAVRRPINASNDFSNMGPAPLAIVGVVSAIGFAIAYLKIEFPSSAAFSITAQNMGALIICLGYFRAAKAGLRSAKIAWLAAGSLIPLWNVVATGFISGGFIVATMVGAFLLSTTSARRWSLTRTAFVTLATGYTWLMFCVAYLSGRAALRDVIWSRDDSTSFIDRIGLVFRTFSNAELLTPANFVAFDWIAMRLNQAAFVGKVVEYHDLVPTLRTYGTTLVLSIFSWVPRSLWPDKPEMGGSRFLAENAGLRFSEGTTFGAGQVVEFYVNFGTWGVFFGFVALGIVVAYFDRKASIEMRSGRFLSSLRFFAAGYAFVSPLSELFFIVSTSAASFLLAHALMVAFEKKVPRRIDRQTPAQRIYS